MRRDDDDPGKSGDAAPAGGGTTGVPDRMETRTLTELGERLLGLEEWSRFPLLPADCLDRDEARGNR